MNIMTSQKFKEEALDRIMSRGKIDYSVSSSVVGIIETVRKEVTKPFCVAPKSLTRQVSPNKD